MSKYLSESPVDYNNSREAPGSTSDLGGGNSVLSSQLTLELRLEQDCKDLLHIYKEAGDWSAVGQLAQSLDTCTSRIRELRKRLEGVENIDPTTSLEETPESDNRAYHPVDHQVGSSPKPLETVLVGVFSSPSAGAGEKEEDRTAGEEISPPAPENNLQAVSRDSSDFCAAETSEGAADPTTTSSDCERDSGSQHIVSIPQKVSPGECTTTDAGQPERTGLNQDITNTSEQCSERRSDSEDEVSKGGEGVKGSPEGVKVTSGVAEFSKASGSTSDLGVDDLDKFTDMMEDLADQFSDLSKQYDDHTVDTAPEGLSCINQDPAPPPTVIINNVDSAPKVVAIATDASSESSEQFFSPRNSLYSGSEVGFNGVEGSADEEQFEDARSGGERDSRGPSLDRDAVAHLPPDASSDPIPAVFSVKQTSPDCSHTITIETTYCVQSMKEECVRMFGRVFSPVFHTYRDFIDLRVQLSSCEEKPSLQTLPDISTDDDSDADILEQFLNCVARQPSLRTTPALLDFLQRGCDGVEHNSLSYHADDDHNQASVVSPCAPLLHLHSNGQAVPQEAPQANNTSSLSTAIPVAKSIVSADEPVQDQNGPLVAAESTLSDKEASPEPEPQLTSNSLSEEEVCVSRAEEVLSETRASEVSVEVQPGAGVKLPLPSSREESAEPENDASPLGTRGEPLAVEGPPDSPALESSHVGAEETEDKETREDSQLETHESSQVVEAKEVSALEVPESDSGPHTTEVEPELELSPQSVPETVPESESSPSEDKPESKPSPQPIPEADLTSDSLPPEAESEQESPSQAIVAESEQESPPQAIPVAESEFGSPPQPAEPDSELHTQPIPGSEVESEIPNKKSSPQPVLDLDSGTTDSPVPVTQPELESQLTPPEGSPEPEVKELSPESVLVSEAEPVREESPSLPEQSPQAVPERSPEQQRPSEPEEKELSLEKPPELVEAELPSERPTTPEEEELSPEKPPELVEAELPSERPTTPEEEELSPEKPPELVEAELPSERPTTPEEEELSPEKPPESELPSERPTTPEKKELPPEKLSESVEAELLTERELPQKRPVETELPPKGSPEPELTPLQPSPEPEPVETQLPPERPPEPVELQSPPERPPEPVETQSPPERPPEPVEAHSPPERPPEPVETQSPPERPPEPLETQSPPERPPEPVETPERSPASAEKDVPSPQHCVSLEPEENQVSPSPEPEPDSRRVKSLSPIPAKPPPPNSVLKGTSPHQSASPEPVENKVSPEPDSRRVKSLSPIPAKPPPPPEAVLTRTSPRQIASPERVVSPSPEPDSRRVKSLSPIPAKPPPPGAVLKKYSPQPSPGISPEPESRSSPGPESGVAVNAAPPQAASPEPEPQQVEKKLPAESSPQPQEENQIQIKEEKAAMSADFESDEPQETIQHTNSDKPQQNPVSELSPGSGAPPVQTTEASEVSSEVVSVSDTVHEQGLGSSPPPMRNPSIGGNIEDSAAQQSAVVASKAEVKSSGESSLAGEEVMPENSEKSQPSPNLLSPTKQSSSLEGSLSPRHSDRVLESSTNTTTSSSSSSAVGNAEFSPEPRGRGSSESLERMGQSMVAQGSESQGLDEGPDTLHMSLMPSGEKQRDKKERKRYKSVHKLSSQIGKSIRKVKRVASQRNARTRVKQEGGSPSLMSPVLTQDWDPTCLLEDLYSDFRPSPTRSSVTGECARCYGYLEKLPKNATKSTVLKGWKRRYFRVVDDKIFYSEDRTSPKALGFVRLSVSRIDLIPEKNQIRIQEKGGQLITLRGRDKEDVTRWHRALLLEAAHPTPNIPMPSSPTGDAGESSVLIIDIGAASVRAGFARSNAYPEVFFPAVASIESTNYEPLASGNEALIPENRYGAYQVYPRKHNVRMDKHDSNLELRALECIINMVIDSLEVDPESTDVLLTLPPSVPEEVRNELVEILFEVFQFSSICFQDQCLLSLYSFNTTSGVVVNIGDHIDVVPIIDGYTIEAGVSHLPHGGNAITESLSKLVTQKGLRYFSETEMYIIRLIKERLCYVSEDFDADLSKCEASPVAYTRATDVDAFQLPDHRKVVALDSECFRAPEGIFDPSKWGKDVPGIHELVWKAVQASPIDQRREMAKKIYLSGGSSVLPGLKERLEKELSQLATTGMTIQVHTSETQQHAAFMGASVLATLGSFQSYLVTREEFNSLGFDALRKWSTT